MIKRTSLALTLFLGGCGFTQTGDLVRGAVDTYGAQAADELLVNTEFVICRAAPVGAVLRRYWRNAETAEAWKKICLDGAELELPAPGSVPAE